MNERAKQLLQKLENLPKNATPERVELLVDAAWEIGYSDMDRAYRLTIEASVQAQEIGYERGQALCHLNLGFYYYSKADFNPALKYTYDALNFFVQTGESGQESQALGTLGLIYWSLGNYDLAVDNFKKGEGLAREAGDLETRGWIVNSLGGVYTELGDYDEARRNHERSLEIFRKEKSQLGQARALTGLGSVLLAQKEYHKAIEYHSKSLRIYSEIENLVGESRALSDIGSVYFELGDLQQSQDYHRRSLVLREEFGNKSMIVTSLLNLGRVYTRQDDFDRAIEILNRAREYASEIYAQPKLLQAHQVLSEAYEGKGVLDKALEHLKAYQKMREEVFGDEVTTRLKNLQIQFEVEKTEKEAEIERIKNVELKQALEQLTQANKELRETQVQLVQSEKMAALGQITAGLAHEINNPVGAIKSSADISVRSLRKIQQILSEADPGLDAEAKRAVTKGLNGLSSNCDVIVEGVGRIGGIVDSLKNFARLDEAEFKEADLHDGIRSTLMLIQHEVPQGVEINKDFAGLPAVAHYPSQMNQVFMTLIRNAVQAIEGAGAVTISTRQHDSDIEITIADTGRGIPANLLDSLFDLNFITKRSRVGVGMGLYNAFNIVQRHAGRMTVESEVGAGTTFRIFLPLSGRQPAGVWQDRELALAQNASPDILDPKSQPKIFESETIKSNG